MQYTLRQSNDASRHKQLEELFTRLFCKIFKKPLKEALFPEDHGEMAQQNKTSDDEKLTETPPKPLKNKSSSGNTDRLDTYTTLKCLICGAMSC